MKICPLAVIVCVEALAATNGLRKTYTGGDGDFRFSYPESLILSPAPESVSATCRGNLVCVEYPETAYKGYDFESAGFWVDIVSRPSESSDFPRPVTNESDCLKFRDYRDQSVPISSTVINGVRFATLSLDGVVATGTGGRARLFRTFRHGRCYELGTAISAASSGIWTMTMLQAG